MRNNKVALYESIMRKVSVEVKKAINESTYGTTSSFRSETPMQRTKRMLNSRSGRIAILDEAKRLVKRGSSLNESYGRRTSTRRATAADLYRKGVNESRQGLRKLLAQSRMINEGRSFRSTRSLRSRSMNESRSGFRHVSARPMRSIGMRRF